MKRILLIALMVSLGGVAHADAANTCAGELLTHPSKVQICVPRGWSKEEKDGSLRLKDSKDWKIQLRLEPIDAANLDAALKKLDAKIADRVKVDWGKAEQIKKEDKENPNMMDGVVIKGPGTRTDNNSAVQVIAAIVMTPAGKIVVVSLIADSQMLADAQNLATVKALLDSIQPTK